MQQSVQDVSVVSGDQQINDGAVLRILQQRRRLTLARQRPARMVRKGSAEQNGSKQTVTPVAASEAPHGG